MGLSGLEIYKLLPKTNCKECGFPTCLAFAMQLAAKKASLEKCPYVSENAKQALESASQPPIRLITIGKGDNQLQVGNETVLFRHEETFHHPTGIGFLLTDNIPENEFISKVDEINRLSFTRVGQVLCVNIIALKDESKNPEQFLSRAKILCANTKLNVLLASKEPTILTKAIDICKDKRPLLGMANSDNYQKISELAKQNKLPLVVSANSLDELAELTQKVKALGVEDMVLHIGKKGRLERLIELIDARRLALKKTFRPLGYPFIVFTESEIATKEVVEASAFVAKYAGIVIMKTIEPWAVLPVLTVRQDIYTDPQKPVQVEPKVYEVGGVNENSPVIVTTNFSITYYTVAGEVEASKVGAYIIACDCEGMSVLTAWAAEKFTPEVISNTLKTSGITERVKHRNVIIPGYVAMMSGKLEEESQWKVLVGPREASGLPSFLKQL